MFVAACVLLGWAQVDELDFVGSAWQFIVSGVAIIALVTAGLLVHQPLLTPVEGNPPAPVWVAFAAFAVTSGYWLTADLPLAGAAAVWAQVAAFVAAAGISVGLVLRWSRRVGWDGRHRVALAGGAVATYAFWFGPAQAGEAGTGAQETAVGALVFGSAALVLIVAAYSRQHRA